MGFSYFTQNIFPRLKRSSSDDLPTPDLRVRPTCGTTISTNHSLECSVAVDNRVREDILSPFPLLIVPSSQDVTVRMWT